LSFSSLVYSSFSFQKSSPISKFERAFEAIRKNEKNCKETLRKYSFREPKRQAGPNEQVSPIFVLDSEEDHQKDDLQQ
jgi:predicted RNA methylase